MTITITSQGQQPYRQVIQAGNHTFFADVAGDKGGQDTAPTPHELLLGAWGACTNMTLQMYAQRKGWPLEAVTTRLEEARNGGKPLIRKTIEVRGQLSPEQMDRLKLIAEKCPVNQLILGEKTMESRIDRIV